MNSTTHVLPNVTTVAIASPEEHIDPVQYEMGAIIGVIFGVLFGVVLVGIAGYLYIKQKRANDKGADQTGRMHGSTRRKDTRKSKVKMTSIRNVDIYDATTVEEKLISDDNYTFTSPEYKSLQKFKSPYEDDSDDELCRLDIERDRDYSRKAKVKLMSSRNAGVYVDTTTRDQLVPEEDVIFTREDYKTLEKFKTPYDDAWEEEL